MLNPEILLLGPHRRKSRLDRGTKGSQTLRWEGDGFEASVLPKNPPLETHRMIEKEPEHLSRGIRPLRVGVGASGTAT